MLVTKNMLALILAGSAMAGTVALTGCATSPASPAAKQTLKDDVDDTTHNLKNEDPTLENFLNNAYGYVIFPSIGKGGAGVAVAYGRGEVFAGGKMVGYADLSQGSIGLSLGGETYREIIAFENADSLATFEANKLEFEAGASAIALKSGAAADAKYTNGVAVFTMPVGGLMFDASIGGQQFTFQASDANGNPMGMPTSMPATTVPFDSTSIGSAGTTSPMAAVTPPRRCRWAI